VPASYDVLVLPNRFPTFQTPALKPAVEGTELHKVAPAEGACEVVLFTPHHEGALWQEPLERVRRVVAVWRERCRVLGAREEVAYVLVFENRGAAFGVTLPHPHGQIYAFPYVPPVPARELAAFEVFRREEGRCLQCAILEAEQADGRRIVAAADGWTAFVPFAARWPYEVHLVPRRHASSLLTLPSEEDDTFARLLRNVLAKYDRLFDRPMPYVVVLHQAPTDGRRHDGYHFHVECLPARRNLEELKYLAGCELGAGTFLNDAHPEEAAEALRRARGV
jgi:UDPglucose--hexose-1-phosphate uridylyltransferase